MGLFNRFKKNGKTDSQNNTDINTLYIEAMRALNEASTLEQKEAALKKAEGILNRMTELEKVTEDKMFATLEREIAAARQEFDESSRVVQQQVEYLEQGLTDIDKTPAAKRVSDVASREARRFLQETFDRPYPEIKKNLKALVECNFNNPLYNELSDSDKKALLYPYFLEKKEVCGLSDDEERIFKDLEMFVMASYVRLENGYTESLENLQFLGLVDITDEATFLQTFDKMVKNGTTRISIADYAAFRRDNKKMMDAASKNWHVR